MVFGACISSSALWTQLFGSGTSQIIVSLFGFANTIVGGVAFIITGQAQQIRDVAAMPGVQQITLNSSASQAAAQVAIDPQQPKVGGTSASVQNILQQTAKG